MGFTVLVLGATGKTGRRVIPQLVQRGVTVRAAGRTPVPERDGVEAARFDWQDEGTYQTALDGVDAVYVVGGHLSDSVSNPTAPAEAFFGRMADAGVRRVVLLSASGVDDVPDPENILRRFELFVEGSGIPSTILRPGVFMQNFSESNAPPSTARIRERSEIALPGGDVPVSYISTVDVAAVAAAALTEDGHEGKGYALTGPEALTLPQVAELISAAVGRTVRHVETRPEEGIRDVLLADGATVEYAEYVARLYVMSVRSGYGTDGSAMTGLPAEDFTTITGRPMTTFAEFTKGAADAWR
ncbi:uncharacterized protein YbjT (DUF2867 family) [Pseudonocardia hierapolitana]|uniref:Uncharacterized protein YbjT (DUF2867 family) n=1 Tax=Pseudonocardia hierapolitana TaxID=1128676 RepID=A0A561SNS4_9PSEU|nr:NAD(P)H-binding protein [Pseudonocardia hierapolitana]TWF76515.1 uncharacterized protein YbjT (DUF2867 family) [Pseudonocardia hierapolitana]